MNTPAWERDALAARLPFLRRRALLTAATRSFFTAPRLHRSRNPVRRTCSWRGSAPQNVRDALHHHPGRGPPDVAAHEPGICHEASAGRWGGPDFSARARLAERGRQRPSRPRIHDAGMVSPRRDNGRPDGRNRSLPPRRPAAHGHDRRHQHRPRHLRSAQLSARPSAGTPAPMCWRPWETPPH